MMYLKIIIIFAILINEIISYSTFNSSQNPIRKAWHGKGPCNIGFTEDGNLERRMYGKKGTQLDMMSVARIIQSFEDSEEMYGCLGSLFTLRSVITSASCLHFKYIK